MLSKSFKASKCNTSLKLATARIKLLKNKREVQLKQMKRELAQLLETGQEQTARIRVEHVFREEKTVTAYDFIGLYCELIAARLPIIESQKNCPIDLKEAIASVIFASPRCADIPELQDVCKQFVAKYGKEFINSALELRPDSGVNHMVIEKLSARTPDAETKIKILSRVAQEHNVKWDSAASKAQVLKPPEDLLNGPHSFLSASKLRMESPDVHFEPSLRQKHEPAAKSFDNDVIKSSPNSRSFSSSNTDIPTASMPMASHPELRTSERKAGVEAFRNSFSEDRKASLKRQNWNMTFEDATSAAQAAAECAERASVAARAAAELSSREYVARQSSTESLESSFYGEAEGRCNGHSSVGRSNMPAPSQSSKTSIDKDTSGGNSNLQNMNGFSQGDSSEFSTRISKTRVSSQINDPFSARFDDSEGPTSENEHENYKFRGKTVSRSSSHKQNVSVRSPSLTQMGHGLTETTLHEKGKAKEVRINTYDTSDAELNVLGNSWRRHGAGYSPDSQGSSRHVKSPRQSNDLDMKPIYSSMSEEQQDLHSSRTTFANKAETNDSFEPHSPATTKRSEFLNYPSDENRSMLNLGRMTGGLRSKAFSQQPYTRVHSSDSSFPAKHETVEETLSISQKQTIFPSDESLVSPGVHDHKPYNQKPRIKVNKELRATSNTHFDSSNPHPQIVISASRGSTKSTQLSSAVENEYMTLPKTVISGITQSPKPLSGSSTSRENSLKNPSHVHPKLPDYDTLAAHFEALRSNRRSL